jgi:hypothetical protein
VRRALAAALYVALAAPPSGAEIPGAVLVLEAGSEAPGTDPAAAPPRFVLLKDGQVFVGGTSLVEAGRLEKGEAQVLLKRAAALRKLPAMGSPVSLGGPGDRRLRLLLLEGQPLEVVATGLPPEASPHIRGGDPARAPASLAPLATLLEDLARFDHPSLRPYTPTAYAVSAREQRLVGGCRAWSFPFPIAEAVAGPRITSAADAYGWPTGATQASVCADERRYAVTLRPLLPDERP